MNARAALALALGALVGGCVIVQDDTAITCGNFDTFLYYCTANCSPNWDCEAQLDSLDPYTQSDLDTCSDCLVANLDAGYCADCSIPAVGIYSCQGFMEDFLGVTCWY